VASLRQSGVPLAQVRAVLDLDAAAAADQVAAYWSGVEAEHAARRELAGYLVDRLNGKRPVMYEVATREVPARRLLCLRRHVDAAGSWALGKEFVGIFRDRPAPRMEGRAGAPFVIYHGEVSEDSDGPVEWCRPVPGDQAEAVAAGFPELTLRTERAHQEAFVPLGNTQAAPPRWELVSEALHAWAAERHLQPADLPARMTLLATLPVTAGSAPDCDFAVPLP
jgi:hypothetical protein